MFQADLDAAGIAYRDESGRYADFHVLRHTFITNLANGGVHPKVAQALARHSTITLTMDRYSHTLTGDQADALDVLPDFDCPAGEKLRATGTAGPETAAKPTSKSLASHLALSSRRQGTLVDSDRLPGSAHVQCKSGVKNVVSTQITPQRRGAGAADRAGLENRCARKCTEGSNPSLSAGWLAHVP